MSRSPSNRAARATALNLQDSCRDGVHDIGLQCSLKRLEYDPVTRIGTLWLVDGDCTDMRGAIDVFTRIDAGVKAIVTWSGGSRDTAYVRDDNGSWSARLMSTTGGPSDAQR